DRMRAKLKEIKEEMRQRRHHSIPEQGHWLRQVVTGFFAYHAVPTNIWSLGTFRFRIIDLWRRSLRRRSQKDGTTWRRVTKLANDFLPRAPHPSSVAPRALHRQTPEVGAECPNGARSVLCGGRSVMSVPTAISEMSAQNIPLKYRVDFR